MILKIADFGFAAPIAGKGDQIEGALKTICGTKGQLAPEIITLQKGMGYSGQHVDIFNAGIVLFNMVFQKMPFGNAIKSDSYYKYIYAEKAEDFWQEHAIKSGLPVDKVS